MWKGESKEKQRKGEKRLSLSPMGGGVIGWLTAGDVRIFYISRVDTATHHRLYKPTSETELKVTPNSGDIKQLWHRVRCSLPIEEETEENAKVVAAV